MKTTKRLLALLLCAALVFSLFGCSQESAPTEPSITETTAPTPSPLELYTTAADALTAGEYARMEADISRTTAVGADTYSKTSHQQYTWKNWGRDAMQGKVTEESTIGGLTTRSTEVYRDGAVYLTMGANAYVSDMAAEDFEGRWLSLIPLTAGLYEQITAEETAEGTMIRFEAPTAVESWAAPDYARILSGSGTAQLDGSGALTGLTYEATFSQGSAQITLTADITILKANALDLTLVYPADDERYVLMETPEIPLLLNDALGYLSQFQSATSTLTQSFSSEALSSGCVIAATLAAQGTEEAHQASVEQQVAVSLYQGGKVYDSYAYTLTDTFLDGVHRFYEDGKEYALDEPVDAAAMYQYCVNTLTENYPYMSEITGGTLTDFGSICLLELDASSALAQYYNKVVCEYLADDPHFLDTKASAYKTNTMDYYWAINQDTGLPTASGITFTGTHTIEDQPYSMSYQSLQTYYIADPGAYEAVTGEPLQSEAPAASPTPLFYKVTGTDGQQMWLLGTIHVGDARTGALPQEIYGALSESAALAVEFDSENFMQSMEEDPALLERIMKSYYYLDGTTTADHLDPAVYAAGMKLLKATGINATQAIVMKPCLWSQTIDSMNLQQGYDLVADKGVDFRLMAYARENDIPIKDVESGLSQIEMLGGFSDALQEMLLAESIGTSAAEYNQGTRELYELWCTGEEAALVEYLAEDTSDMTKQEQALYQEYRKAISTDRNADMLEVAREYLESGEVIFYAVGLAHLLAEDGLVNTLRDAGYTVELVSYSK